MKVEVVDDAVLEAIASISRRLEDMQPALDLVDQALVEGSHDRILAGHNWTGARFAPNSPATMARKKGTKPLVGSKSFVTSRLHYEAGRDSVAVGSSRPSRPG
ncbi:hypothetical protein TDMWS_17510 [Thermodesulfomicrobium sp. WS]|uniref:phage virion morphogenesis protein n=1 Tax=Thermodesulfomicrobium sp. WS TaxID=3004129 RepID=UPI0024906B01|nr:phage virion morphogenesis protein [Thermodesulfomicrobium sp. WS]BDV01666.1 hypothetical protein TDMWS_17510 [Thermodesulfomicrobium sp. WS]